MVFPSVLTTAQPGYLRNLISVDSPHIETSSFSSVTLSRPSSSSSLKITDRSFRYASPCPQNKLLTSFLQPNPDHTFSYSSQPNCLSSSVPSSPLSLSITPTLFHSKLKRYLFLKSFPPYRVPHPFHKFHHCLYGHHAMALFLVFPLTFLVWFVQQTKLTSCRFLIAPFAH